MRARDPLSFAMAAAIGGGGGIRAQVEMHVPFPAMASLPAMAFDESRLELVIFGGAVARPRDETWVWTGQQFVRRFPRNSPGPRSGAAMVWHRARNRVLMFGGGDGQATFDDLYEWDGSDWTLLAASGPSPRTGAGLTYDTVRNRVRLYGGQTSNGSALGDMWEWDGAVWSQVTWSGAGPGARRGHVFCFDEGRGETLLFGGVGNATTWIWNGTWTQRLTTSSPASDGAAAAFHAARNAIVLFGGLGSRPQDTHEWTGTDWRVVPSTLQLEIRTGHRMAYDPARGDLLLYGGMRWFGGHTFVGPDPSLYAWNGSWRVLHHHTVAGAGIVHDVASGKNVLYGGHHFVQLTIPTAHPSGHTWTYDGVTVSYRALVAPPPPRWIQRMVHDRQRARTVFLGGSGASGVTFNDHWEWDGVAWSSQPVVTPPPRLQPAMAYDRARRRIVLFGGGQTPNWLMGDTWSFDGVAWRQLQFAPGQFPAARASPLMAFDIRSASVLMVGGYAMVGSLAVRSAETWFLDGSGWRRSTAQAPTHVPQLVLVEDDDRGRPVLLSGTIATGAPIEVWDFAGDRWVPRLQTTERMPMLDATYDATRGRIVVVGREEGMFEFAVPIDSIGPGDAQGSVRLAVQGRPAPGRSVTLSLPAGSVGIVCAAHGPATFPARVFDGPPLCGPVSIYPDLAGLGVLAVGNATTLTVPNTPSIAFATLCAQALVPVGSCWTASDAVFVRVQPQ